MTQTPGVAKANPFIGESGLSPPQFPSGQEAGSAMLSFPHGCLQSGVSASAVSGCSSRPQVGSGRTCLSGMLMWAGLGGITAAWVGRPSVSPTIAFGNVGITFLKLLPAFWGQRHLQEILKFFWLIVKQCHLLSSLCMRRKCTVCLKSWIISGGHLEIFLSSLQSKVDLQLVIFRQRHHSPGVKGHRQACSWFTVEKLEVDS